jgi:hypothetical protein
LDGAQLLLDVEEVLKRHVMPPLAIGYRIMARGVTLVIHAVGAAWFECETLHRRPKITLLKSSRFSES